MVDISKMLLSMCRYLVSVQRDDGSFFCETCGFEHGRADNAVFPFLCCWMMTHDNMWIERTARLLDFREKLENNDGSVSNDFESPWKGITVFSAICLYKALKYCGDAMPALLRKRIEIKFINAAGWVHENIRPGFKANINYYCASAAVNAMYGTMYRNHEYIRQAYELLEYCMNLFTENGIIRGEGQPHNTVTKSGCVPADIGYIVEEAIPCLTDAAAAVEDEILLEKLADYSCKLLEFMLPDGAWDNSFGSRNNKWTYYGSRTASGCIGAFKRLSVYRSELLEAAYRNFELIEKCSENGVLYGGPEYSKYGQKACVHHTFTHAVSIADALMSGLKVNEPHNRNLPCDNPQNRIKYFPELNTYKIYSGKWIATVTGYDYGTYTRKNGAAHSSGGSLSMLYHRDKGPVIAGSVLEYRRTETNNMQEPAGMIVHSSLMSGIEKVVDGSVFSTSLCSDSEISITELKDCNGYSVKVKTRPESPDGRVIPGSEYTLEYVFMEDKTEIRLTNNAEYDGSMYVLPVISASGIIAEGNYEKKEKVFFLTGGFGADKYYFLPENTPIIMK